MNYQRIHDEIISKARERDTTEGYFETHHIVPNSMGGSSEETNLVKLYPREHYMIHWLLFKIHRNKSMAHAWNTMACIGLSGKRYTSKSSKYAREAFVRSRSTKHPDRDLSMPFRSGTRSGGGRPVKATCVDEGCVVIFDSAGWAAKCIIGDQSSITRCCAGKASMHKGYFWEYLDKGPATTYRTSRLVRTKDGVSEIFESYDEAIEGTYKASKGHIASCCKGHRATHAGYTWSYESDEE